MGVHNPYFYEPQDAHTIIIFIHGFMGSPDQFKQMIAAAENHGYAVSAILLPGHGGTTDDFNKSNRRKWEEAVREHIDQMRERYANIILVGHSMGSLLAFAVSSNYSNIIKGIVAIATPINVLIKPKSIKTSYSVALGKINQDSPWEKAAYDFCSVKRLSVWAYTRSIPRFFDLFHLMSMTRKRLNQVEIPTLIIHSLDDEVASIKSIKTLEKRLRQSETIKLYNSGHYYYSDSDTKIVLEKFTQFINKLKTSYMSHFV